MAKLQRITREDGSLYGYAFECLGCGRSHIVPTTGSVAWDFNGNVDYPTFAPSILVYEVKHPDGSIFQPRCHSVLTNGQIRFQGDCGHAYAGQTVDVPEWSGKW